MNTLNQQTMNVRARDPSKPPQHPVWAHLRYLSRSWYSLWHSTTQEHHLRPCKQGGCRGAVLTSSIQSKACCPVPHRDAHATASLTGGQKPVAAAGGQCPELRTKQDKWPCHCLSSTGQIGKSQAEAMSRKGWVTLQGTIKFFHGCHAPTYSAQKDVKQSFSLRNKHPCCWHKNHSGKELSPG